MKQGCLLSLSVLVLVAGCSSMHREAGHHSAGADRCSEYRATMAGKSIEEQRKAAEAHIVQMHGSSDAAHVERHIQMMEKRCGGGAQDQPKG